MHYKNGRKAEIGDKVVLFPTGHGYPVVGVLIDAVPGNNYCNGTLLPLQHNAVCPNLRECLHYDDVKAAVEATGVKFDNQDEPSNKSS